MSPLSIVRGNAPASFPISYGRSDRGLPATAAVCVLLRFGWLRVFAIGIGVRCRRRRFTPAYASGRFGRLHLFRRQSRGRQGEAEGEQETTTGQGHEEISVKYFRCKLLSLL